MIRNASKLLLIFSVLTSPVAMAKDASTKARSHENPLVGTWRLVRYADTLDGGRTIHAFGEAPIGQFIFTKDGHISVHIMHNPPAPANAPVDPDPDACMPSWYCAYFGSYTFNKKDNSWLTRVKGGNIVSYVGTDQKRRFSIKGDQLIISEKYRSADGVQVTAERVLVRAGATPK